MPMVRWARRASSLALTGLVGCATVGPDTVPTPPEPAGRYKPAPDVTPPPAVPRGQADEAEAQPREKTAPPRFPVRIPPGLPGGAVPVPDVPEDKPETKAERTRVLDKLFPDLPPPGPDPVVDGADGVRRVGLEDLQEFARRNSPLIAQAAAAVEEARGQWIQVGLYPNPTAGFQGDQVGDAGSAGQLGGFFNQTIVTAGKLKLARSVSYFDYLNAKLRLRRAEADLARQVRSDYYAALVAAETVRVTRLMTVFTEEVYRRQVGLVRSGDAAPFEASALRAVVNQVRATGIQARNRYASAWKQLAATLSAPDMPPAPLAGQVDEIAPEYRFQAIRDRVLAAHTDLAVARNQASQAEVSLSVERRRPIPDIQNNFYFQNDTQLNSFQMGVQIGIQVPVWNRNQGNITAAQATILRLSRENDRVRNDLLRQLADAFERYNSAREQLALLRDQTLPDLIVAFRGVYERFELEPAKVNYNDIVTAQQNLGGQLTNYLTLLNQQWQAASDLAGVAQALTLGELLKDPTPAGPDSWADGGPNAPPPGRTPAPLPLPKPVPVPPVK